MTSDSAQAPPPIPVQSEAAGEDDPPLRRVSPLRVTAVITLGFALFVSASIGLSLVIWRDSSNTSTQRVVGGSAGLPSAGGTDPIGYLDERTRTATIGPASLTMPGDPYVLSPRPDGHSWGAGSSLLGRRPSPHSLRRQTRLVVRRAARSGGRTG